LISVANEGAGHAVIFAVSGATGSVSPIFDVQPVSISAFVGSNASLSATVSGSQPITYKWMAGTNGASVVDGGTISGATTSTLTFNGISLTNAGSYLLVASNVSGVSTSLVANVNVLSTNVDVTSPSDTIVAVDGTSPAAEVVAMAIDDTTSKYLNFGLDGDQAAPFVGPVGLIVTPAAGPTVVVGLRIYTANDAVERDPIDYKLDGSNDGTNFVAIASGSLSLPDGRNPGAQPLDPLAQFNQEVLFTNGNSYTDYRLLFSHVKNDATANSVQIGEVEFLGTVGQATTPQVSIAKNADGTITISSSIAGTLESTVNLSSSPTWQNEGAINTTVTVTPSEAHKFYRVTTQ
jgi:hypothetical protein